MNKDCEQCGGKGAQLCIKAHDTGLTYSEAQLCPCVAERMAKLERVAEAAKAVSEALTDLVDWHDPTCDCWHHQALAALEETK